MTSNTFSAAATYQGLTAQPDRPILTLQYGALQGIRRERMDAAADRAVARLSIVLGPEAGNDTGEPLPAQVGAKLLAAGIAAVNHALRLAAHGETLDDEQAAWLIALLHHLPVRDYAWIHCTGSHKELPLWADLTRRAPTDMAAPPASLLAFCALASGDGVVANIALDRAQAAGPAYTLAKLLRQAIGAGLPPVKLRDALASAAATGIDTAAAC